MTRLLKLLVAIVAVAAWSCESKPAAKTSPQAPAKTGCDDKSLRLTQADTTDEPEADTDGTTDEADADAKITYEDDLKEVIDDECLACHSKNGTKEPPLLDTWTQVKAEKAKVASEVASGSMPDGSTLTTAQKKLFADWKADGYLEKKTTSTSTDDEEEEEETEEESDDSSTSDDDCAASDD